MTTITTDEDATALVESGQELGLDGVKIIIGSGPPPWYPNARTSVETTGAIV